MLASGPGAGDHGVVRTILLLLIASPLLGLALGQSKRPNILFLMSDDQGWNGTSLQMDAGLEASASDVVQTPALERLAKEGRLFSQAYAPAPTCAPTRVAIQTGLRPASLGWGNRSKDLDGERVTLGEVMKEAGYATAHFGKWHLGAGGPAKHGYEVSDGDVGNEAAAKFGPPNPCDIFGMCERTEAFIRQSVEEERPFFAQLSWLALHSPDNARPETVEALRERLGRSARRRSVERLALAEDLDAGVARLLDFLDEMEIADETLVIYASDNGGAVGGTRVLRGGKGSLWEGGIRVPFVVRGPGVKPGRSDTAISLLDLYPTFAELAGAEKKLPEDVQGGSLIDVLRGKSDKVERAVPGLLFQLPRAEEGDPQAAIVDGKWKLVRYDSGEVELFDLEQDLAEREDRAEEEEQVAADLRGRLEESLTEYANQPRRGSGGRRRRDR